MNNQSKVQQQPPNQFFHCQKVVSKPERLICTTQVNIPKEVIKFDPTNFTTTVSRANAACCGFNSIW